MNGFIYREIISIQYARDDELWMLSCRSPMADDDGSKQQQLYIAISRPSVDRIRLIDGKQIIILFLGTGDEMMIAKCKSQEHS